MRGLLINDQRISIHESSAGWKVTNTYEDVKFVALQTIARMDPTERQHILGRMFNDLPLFMLRLACLGTKRNDVAGWHG